MNEQKTPARQELYERVWKDPMIKVAAEFGLSDRGLRSSGRPYGVVDNLPGITASDASCDQGVQDLCPAVLSPLEKNTAVSERSYNDLGDATQIVAQT